MFGYFFWRTWCCFHCQVKHSFGLRVACEIDMGSGLRSGRPQVTGRPGSASFAHQLRKPLKWGRQSRWGRWEGLQECFLMNLADLGRHFLWHIECWLWAKRQGGTGPTGAAQMPPEHGKRLWDTEPTAAAAADWRRLPAPSSKRDAHICFTILLQ